MKPAESFIAKVELPEYGNRTYVHFLVKFARSSPTAKDIPLLLALGEVLHDRARGDAAREGTRLSPLTQLMFAAENATVEKLATIESFGWQCKKLDQRLYTETIKRGVSELETWWAKNKSNGQIDGPPPSNAAHRSNDGLFHLCVYTIKHSDDLLAALKSNGNATFSEGTKWNKANQLLKEAHSLGLRLPVVFAPAEGTRRLFGWATVDDIKLGDRTEYRFSNLIAFRNRPLKTTLKKQSDGLAISADYIRPYLICQTPDYLLAAASTDSQTADSIAEALEGTRTEIKHLTSKRSRRLRDSAFSNANGVCAVCGRNFTNLLSGRGTRTLQVHHRKQLSAFEMPTVTTLEDLAVVCANCHCLLHLNPKKALLIEELKTMLSSENYP